MRTVVRSFYEKDAAKLDHDFALAILENSSRGVPVEPMDVVSKFRTYLVVSVSRERRGADSTGTTRYSS